MDELNSIQNYLNLLSADKRDILLIMRYVLRPVADGILIPKLTGEAVTGVAAHLINRDVKALCTYVVRTPLAGVGIN